ncbi:MAG TPA: proton-conducting transporter membrane subunit, partial [Thermoanaerobaculia bacterium]|nr:proton-conducting transporter membrane subunit [Thermoanaerobaculia bacterium]
MTWNDTVFMLPEIVIALGASLLLCLPVLGARRDPGMAKWWTLAILALTAAAVLFSSHRVVHLGQSHGFAAMFALDSFAIFFKMLFIATIALVVILSDEYLLTSRYSPWEYYSLLAFALCGMMFMASGTHLISIYIGLELLSLSSYVLAGYFKTEEKSTEAAMKYFVLGAVSSGILLYGLSLIYGVCGSLNLYRVADAMSTTVANDAL